MLTKIFLRGQLKNKVLFVNLEIDLLHGEL